MLAAIISKRDLIWQLVRREILNRYRGSFLGVAWAIITPLLMLLIYTFVFGVIFKSRWSGQVSSNFEFALVLYCGLLTYSIFSETIMRAPQLVLGNPSYVKKVIFPLEILPVISLGAALTNAMLALIILCLACLGLLGTIHWTIIFWPLVLVPLILFTLGLSWFVASLSVYFRDLVQMMPIAITALMFVTPVFYPVSAVPERVRPFFMLNPLAFVVEQSRQVVLWGQLPDWLMLSAYTAVGALVAYLGFYWFEKTRRGFADVI